MTNDNPRVLLDNDALIVAMDAKGIRTRIGRARVLGVAESSLLRAEAGQPVGQGLLSGLFAVFGLRCGYLLKAAQ